MCVNIHTCDTALFFCRFYHNNHTALCLDVIALYRRKTMLIMMNFVVLSCMAKIKLSYIFYLLS